MAIQSVVNALANSANNPLQRQLSPAAKNALSILLIHNKNNSIDIETANYSQTQAKQFDTNNAIISEYVTQTGISEDRPAIIVSSEFIPFDTMNNEIATSANTTVGTALSVKEISNILSAKNVTTLLTGSSSMKNAVKSNIEIITSFASSESSFLINVLGNLNDAIASLNPRRVNSSGNSLVDMLKKRSYDSNACSKYSYTKIWMQELIELKDDLLGATQFLFDKSEVTSDLDVGPWIVTNKPNRQKIWHNSYLTSLPIIEVMNAKTAEEAKKRIDEVTSINDQLYVNLKDKKTMLSQLDSYKGTGRDIAIIANSLSKERLYSNALKLNETILTQKFGYAIDRTKEGNGNFAVWDYIIGRAPKDVTRFIATPTGNGSSLVSLAQQFDPADQTIQILTLENSYIPDSSLTPGAYYFIESALGEWSSQNGVFTFNIDRLKSFKNKISSCFNVFTLIDSFLSMTPIQLNRDEHTASEIDCLPKQFIQNIFDRLKPIKNVYNKCIMKEGVIDTTNLSNDEQVIRLIALIAKCAISPTKQYEQVANTLKSALFLWLLNELWTESQQSQNHVFLDQISAILTSVSSNSTNTTNGFEIHSSEISYWENYSATRGTFSVATVGGHGTLIDGSQWATDQLNKTTKDDIISKFNDTISGNDNSLFFVMKKMIRRVFEEHDLDPRNFSSYTGCDVLVYSLAYFDLMLRMIAAITPENLTGLVDFIDEEVGETITGALRTVDGVNNLTSVQDENLPYAATHHVKKRTVLFGVDTPSKEQVFSMYGSTLANAFSDGALHDYEASLIETAKKISTSDINSLIENKNTVFLMLSDIDVGISNFINAISGERASNYISNIASLSTGDQQIPNKLLANAFTEGQFALSSIQTSEVLDRVKSEHEEAMTRIPLFADFQPGFIDFMPINDTDLTSHTLLSSFFNSKEFQVVKGNNKRILSIGIPPRLMRLLETSTASNSSNSDAALKQKIFRIKLFRMDYQHNTLKFKPMEFLFQSNRYPTRVLSNWDTAAFSSDAVDLKNIPTKLFNGISVELHKNYSAAAASLGQTFLTEDERQQLYKNHAMSFLLEEYMRWFTDCDFSESNYKNYGTLTDNTIAKEQYNKAVANLSIDAVGRNLQSVNAVFESSYNGGNMLSFPIVVGGNQTNDSSTLQQLTLVDLSNSMRQYFKKETFIADPENVKRSLSYPKKFDRVFNVIFDPDDFEIDESEPTNNSQNPGGTGVSNLKKLKDAGVIIGGPAEDESASTKYMCRTSSPGDYSFDQYFCTIEPYTFVQEYTQIDLNASNPVSEQINRQTSISNIVKWA